MTRSLELCAVLLSMALLSTAGVACDSDVNDVDPIEDARVMMTEDASLDAEADADTDVDADANTDEPARDAAADDAAVGPGASDMSIHLHHVHMNVKSPAASMAFYQDFFAAQPTTLNDESDVLLAGGVLLMMEPTDAPSSALPTALQHVGWGASDPIAWFEDAHARGIEPDTRGHSVFQTNPTPTPSGTGQQLAAFIETEIPACFTLQDQIAYVYLLGPDEERIELWSGSDERVNHLHFTSADVPSALAWYQDFFEVEASASTFFVDDILFFFEADGVAADYEPTESHVLGHIAFSVAELSSWHDRAEDLGIEIVAEPAMSHGFESFFVRGPDNLLIELVQATPAPTLCADAP